MLRLTWISLLVIILDQATKLASEALLTLHEPIPVLTGFNITLVYNTGAAFSFLSNAGGWQKWFFIALAIAVSIGIVSWLRCSCMTSRSKWMAVALCLIMGGALGNALDRVIHGHVIDFIDLYYDCYHWPAFNIADIAISVGAAILIIQEIFFIKEEHSHHEPAEHH